MRMTNMKLCAEKWLTNVVRTMGQIRFVRVPNKVCPYKNSFMDKTDILCFVISKCFRTKRTDKRIIYIFVCPYVPVGP